jgi:Dolichyl-phosphate-mannose-protein mannosyltransferase
MCIDSRSAAENRAIELAWVLFCANRKSEKVMSPSPVAEDQCTAVVDVLVAEGVPTSVIGGIRSALRNNPWMEWLIPAALCAVLLGQLFLSVRQLSEICDESTHLFAGYRYLKCGAVDFSLEHPPLARMVAAAPLLPMNLKMDCSPVIGDDAQQAMGAHNWLYSQQDWQAALFRARMAVSGFAVGLCLLVWIAARRMFGLTTAITATILLILEPNVLANGALVMTDIPSTCTLFFAVFGFYLWVRNRTAPFLLLAGLATGLALLAKHSGVLAIPILCLLAIADPYIQPENERPPSSMALRNLLAVVAICALAMGIVWAGYGMQLAPKGLQPGLLPQPYLQGFAAALALTNHAAPVFTLGNIYQHTPWFFVPLNFAIRSTAAFLIMIPLAAFGASFLIQQHRRQFLFLLLPAGIYLVVCLHAESIGGIRHLLPMLPFLLIVVAAGCVALAQRVRWVPYAVICLIVLHAASSLHASPNYLSYANEFWGGPTKAYQYLPAIDLGQGYPQARDYVQRHPANPCWLLTGWQWSPGFYGVPCQFVGRIPPRMRGTVIVSSTLLASASAEQVEAVAPFTRVRPKDSIGGSTLLVFEGDFDTSAAAGMSAWRAALMSQTPEAALQNADDAVALAPKSQHAHEVRCLILGKSGHPFAAIAECEYAVQLAQGDPVHRAEFQQSREAEVQELIRQIRLAYYLPNP